jgi:hypothetical protein
VATKPPSATGEKPLPTDAAAEVAVREARPPSAISGLVAPPPAGAAPQAGAGVGQAAPTTPTQGLARVPTPGAEAGRVATPDTRTRAAAREATDAAATPAAPGRAERSPASLADLPVTAFRRATTDEAVRRLGGSIRLLDGLFSDQVQVGPGRQVPGADPNRDLVRVVYSDAAGRRLTLDEQRLLLPADTSTAARLTYLMNAVGLVHGDTLITASPDGTTRIRLLDRKNFWISLTGAMSPDSLRALVERIR